MKNMKVGFYLTVILLISFPITTSIATNNNSELYRNQEKHFSIYFPNGWSIEKGRNPHVVVKSRSIDKIASIIITHIKLKGYIPITKTLTPKDMVKKYRDSGWGIKILNSGETNFWNEEALFIKFLATINHMGKVIKMIMWQIAFNHFNESYSIGLTVGGSTNEIVNTNFNYYEPYFRRSLATFTLDDWNR